MSLRWQLALIALLLLVLPVAGWQFARQVERTLRAGHADALFDSARTTARLVAERADTPWLGPDTPLLFARRPEARPILDGYPDDWAIDPANEETGSGARLTAAVHEQTLQLLFQVRSPRQVYSQPGRGDGDRLELEFERADGLRGTVELAPLAPGWVESRGRNSEGWPRVQGYWQPGARGWTVELQVPDQPRIETLSWRVVDVDDRARNSDARRYGPDTALTVMRPDRPLDGLLASLLPDRTRAWVSLPSGWVLARARRDGPEDQEPASPSWLDTILFERLASDSIGVGPSRGPETVRLSALPEPTSWTTRDDQPGVTLSAAAPIERDGETVGVLLLERDADRLLLDSNRAVLRLLSINLGVFAGVALLLLAYATWLSLRIRRLRDLAEASVGEDGQVRQTPSPPRSGDELGDLGRTVTQLLGRLREHQSYLRTLADKLAHELRTPLAMIRSSLDNMEHAEALDDIERYRQRASEGSDRLNRIFRAMSQASRIEESLAHEALEAIDLGEFLRTYLEACADTYPERRFELELPAQAKRKGASTDAESLRILAAPDLLAQLLDKLIENAVDFSPPGSRIAVTALRVDQRIVMHIDNEGPALPEDSDTLFDSMVSVRKTRGQGVHLGLGLSIVRLIAEHHQGRVRASNRPGGVRFSVSFPA
ncbi:ATP-binding protein [Wenzhouxiangella marina]|uniref:histidine kinase n=1 Tax=Wenzhouxiangella marina TaxID=1579979 RepID=A0A0K0XVG8_9GAMM|nr:ATP-binding protein [Wenzhouxiangella marina]AKS41622.1 hypothetical protein WM2015_1248 [Wenzhouxiangella marina]MBB6086619.1 signal transduction histidine kinase [Wenzhouxiangella marina]